MSDNFIGHCSPPSPESPFLQTVIPTFVRCGSLEKLHWMFETSIGSEKTRNRLSIAKTRSCRRMSVKCENETWAEGVSCGIRQRFGRRCFAQIDLSLTCWCEVFDAIVRCLSHSHVSLTATFSVPSGYSRDFWAKLTGTMGKQRSWDHKSDGQFPSFENWE
jgi:hypothetical protein